MEVGWRMLHVRFGTGYIMREITVFNCLHTFYDMVLANISIYFGLVAIYLFVNNVSTKILFKHD